MDPVTVLCSILTIADASKKVSDVCTAYVAHAKNAPKELQTVIEDIHALNGTMKKVDSLAKSTKRTRDNALRFDQWELPLTRIEEYAKELVQLISQLDLRVGFFHELGFRARWARGWRAIESLLSKIRTEKDELRLAASMDGTEMIGMVFEILDERSSNYQPAGPRHMSYLSGHYTTWEKVDQKHCSPDQVQTLILQRLGDYIGWRLAKYEYPSFDDPHQDNIARSAEYANEPFLETNVYQKWKTRKTRGPSLLYAIGHAVTGKSTLCCRIIQDLQSSLDSDVGVAYFYFTSINGHSSSRILTMLRFWIIQLASQCRSLPVGVLTKNREAEKSYNFAGLKLLLGSLLPCFRRTFLLIDGIDETSVNPESQHRMVKFLQDILEQDLGCISMAIFSRPHSSFEPLLQLADVSIQLTQFEPELSQYAHYRIARKVKPMLVAANLDYDSDLIATIEQVISHAADGLYLGVDVLIDSLLATIRTNRNVTAFLRQTHENNEIMLQRDPESMKQKAFGIETPNPKAGPSNSFDSQKTVPR